MVVLVGSFKPVGDCWQLWFSGMQSVPWVSFYPRTARGCLSTVVGLRNAGLPLPPDRILLTRPDNLLKTTLLTFFQQSTHRRCNLSSENQFPNLRTGEHLVWGRAGQAGR